MGLLMETITLDKIKKQKNRVSFLFTVSNGLKKYFTGKEFFIEYSDNIESVPNSVLAIPFTANVMPIIWVSDSELLLDEIDEDFYDCLNKVAEGYESIFDGVKFKGKLTAGKKVKNQPNGDKSAMFYSGGLDSTQTLINHYKENPDLLSIWGSDIKCDNFEGWRIVQQGLIEGAKQFGLDNIIIRSSFRAFDNECALDNDYSAVLKDGWWHGVKHGLGLLGHVAPLAYLRKYNKFYIASTYSEHYGKVRCASTPTTDNKVKFAGCQVIHDGYEFSRQNKIYNLVEFAKSDFPVKLHVCWESQSGDNCCRCEKCYRTIFGILTENGDPEAFGFNNVEQAIQRFNINRLKDNIKNAKHLQLEWTLIAKRIADNKNALSNNKYWYKIRTIQGFDSNKPKSLKPSLRYTIKKRAISFLRKVKRKGGSLKRKINGIPENLRYKRNFNKDGYDVFLIGTPIHTNIGDSAITVSEIAFIKALGYKVKEISFNEYKRYVRIINKRILKSRKLVLLHGGGNMGNQWLREEILRRNILRSITKNTIFVFPQTIFYTPDATGESEKLKSVDFYNNKKTLTLVAREQVSFDLMKELYPNTEILLSPDIVLSADPSAFDIERHERKGILFILREDPEKAMSDDIRSNLIKKVEELGVDYRLSDMYSDKPVTKENRAAIVSEKMNEFAAAKLVITDRLHGMVFAAITATPCIVFGNYNQKVKGTYDWISYLPYIKFTDSVKEAEKLIPELMNTSDCKYDNGPLKPYFEKIKEVIAEKCPK